MPNPIDSELRVFRVGPWRIDGDTMRATNGAHSRTLEPRAYKVLRHLAERPGELVSIDDLMDAHWTGTVVTPNAVTRVIAHLRKVLDDDAKNPKYIETVSRVGYRCIAETGTDRAAVRPARNVLRAAILLIVVALGSVVLWQDAPGPARVAVLPFENLTGDPALDYLSDGVAEEVIGLLAKHQDINVSARGQSFKYRDTSFDTDAVMEDLQVRYLVLGSVRKSGNQVRIAARLVDSGNHLWSVTESRDSGELFSGQEAVSRGVLDAVIKNANLEEAADALGRIATPAADAYDLYLRGRYIWHRRGQQPLQLAIDQFREAIDLDPSFAKGWSALATAYLSYPSYSPRGYATWNQAEHTAKTAIDLDPTLGEPYSVLATFAATRHQWIESETLHQQAIAQRPLSPTSVYWYGQFQQITGRHTDSAKLLKQTLELDPGYMPPATAVAFLRLDFHDYEGAATQFNDLWQQGMQTPFTWIGRFVASILNDDYETAKALATLKQQDAMQHTYLNRFLAVEFEGALDPELGTEIVQFFWGRPDYAIGVWLGARLGSLDAVFDMLETRLDNGWLVELRPLWSPGTDISRHPRFVPLMSRVGLIELWQASTWADACRSSDSGVVCDTDSLDPGIIAGIFSAASASGNADTREVDASL